MLTSSAAETLRRRRDRHRRRDPRPRPDQARRPPRPVARTARGDHGDVAAAHRPVGHAAPARGGRPLPRRLVGARRAARRSPSSTPASASRSRSRSSSRSRTWATSARPHRRRTACAAAGPHRRGAAAHQHLAEHLPAHPRPDPRPPLDDHLLQRPPPGRAPRRQAQRAGARSGHRRRSRERARPRVELVKAHHGSLAREQRVVVEDQLKRGELRAIVATSSLELGIDMGAVDLVIQVESPGAVSRGLQRIGRAGHSVGEPSKGTIYPKHRGDLLEAAVVARRMLDGEIESTRYLRNPLDVLAQQIVAHVAAQPRDGRVRRARRARPALRQLRRAVRRAARNTLDLLAGRYPSEEFSELRPRLVWDRVNDTLRARDGSKRLAVTSGGTIPDRGLFGVFLPDGTRVGELDEEMVYESRPGETFVLGASTWRIEDITFETGHRHPGARASRARCRSGTATVRAARSSSAGRSGRSCARCASCRRRTPPSIASATTTRLDELAAAQPRAVPRRAGRGHRRRARRPHDRRRALPRRDRRLAGVRAQPVRHAGARAVGDGDRAPPDRPLRPAGRVDVGRRRHRAAAARGRRRAADRGAPDRPRRHRRADRRRRCRRRRCSRRGSASAPARALLLPRRRPDQRTPLWQQRQRAADLLAVAAKYPTFPILLETSRECLQDVFDVPALREVLGQLRTPDRARGQRRHGEAEPDGAEPAVQLDRRLHVRGRRPARRAAGGGAGARP